MSPTTTQWAPLSPKSDDPLWEIPFLPFAPLYPISLPFQPFRVKNRELSAYGKVNNRETLANESKRPLINWRDSLKIFKSEREIA